MLSNRQIKLIQSLKQKKFRKQEELFVTEGDKIASEILQSTSFEIFEIFALKNWINENQLILNNYESKVFEVSEKELSKISFLTTPNQVLVLIKTPTNKSRVTDWEIAVEDLQDPGNLGTIIRIADWYGIEKVVLSENSVDVYNPKVVQSTMGSIARVTVEYHPLKAYLKQQEKPIFAAALGGEPLNSFQFPSNGILLMGNESQGLSDEIKALATKELEIPRFGKAESLNVSVATAIFCHEIRR